MKKLLYTLTLVGTLALTACDHKELCMDHGHMTDVEVAFDWQQVSDANPKTMVVQIFNTDGTHYMRNEFVGKDGGAIRADAGEYNIICHNGEMETVDEIEAQWDGYYLTCVSQGLLEPMGRDGKAPRPEGTDNQPVVSPPNQVWTALHEHFQVKPLTTDQKLILSPVEVTTNCTILIDSVENLGTGISVSAALSGMSGSYHIIRGTHFGEPVTMPVALSQQGDNQLVADFKIFGHCPEDEIKHILTIYTSDKHYYNFDVTAQMHSQTADPNHLIITIGHLKLPEPQPEGGGMSPSFSEWEEVEVIGVDMH